MKPQQPAMSQGAKSSKHCLIDEENVTKRPSSSKEGLLFSFIDKDRLRIACFRGRKYDEFS